MCKAQGTYQRDPNETYKRDLYTRHVIYVSVCKSKETYKKDLYARHEIYASVCT